jgi:tRNA(Arg) A34 adenosine deaminase TadA
MTDLTTRDATFLRRAIALASSVAANGQRPFGTAVVDAGGHVVAEACSTQTIDRDWTAHAELNAIPAAGRKLGWDQLAGATLYASGDSCPMCAGALVWSNIRRLVHGVDEAIAPHRAFWGAARAEEGWV